MSTRSSIGIITGEDEDIKAIYCHSDGYPSYMGELLKNNYASADKVEAILAEGDVSFLAETIEASRFYNSWRGENTKASLFASQQDWIEWAENCGLEYVYLFNGHQWIVREI
jgi:hypothetical protein